MYQRFSDRARKIMQLATQQAQIFNHEYIGSEHILLGLIKEGSGVAVNVLQNLDVDLDKIRREVERGLQTYPELVPGKLPIAPRAKKVIEYAMEESDKFGHNYIGSEHLLLGLIRERDGVAAQVLMHLGVTFSDVREEIAELLGVTNTSDADEVDFHSVITEFVDLQQVEYTDRARKVMMFAAEEAFNLGHIYVGAEHIFLAVLREGTGRANRLLEERNLKSDTLREFMIQLVENETQAGFQLEFQLSSSATFCLIMARKEVQNDSEKVIDSDHLFLSMLQLDQGIVARLFEKVGNVRTELIEILRRDLGGDS